MVQDDLLWTQVLPLLLLGLCRTNHEEFSASRAESLTLFSDPVLDIRSELNTIVVSAQGCSVYPKHDQTTQQRYGLAAIMPTRK